MAKSASQHRVATLAQPTQLNRHTQTGMVMPGEWVYARNGRGSPRSMPNRLHQHKLPRRMASRHEAPQGMPGGLCRILRGGPRRVPGAWRERARTCRSVPEHVNHVKLQTKGRNGALLCSDRHSSPGELRIAKGQTSAGKRANAGRHPFWVMASCHRRRTTKDQEVFSPSRVSKL